MAPLFSSFDEAWRWFLAGGELVPLAEQRERFTHGRAQFLSFQVPIGDMPVADDIASLQDELADCDGLVLLAPELLHISIRGAGFQVISKVRPDDVLREDVPRIGERAARALAAAAPFEIEIGPVNVFPDALILEVHDHDELRGLLRALASTGTEDAFPYAPEQYLPHITLGMFETPEAAPPLRERLPALRERPQLQTTVRRVELARWWFTGEDASEEPERETVRTYTLRA